MSPNLEEDLRLVTESAGRPIGAVLRGMILDGEVTAVRDPSGQVQRRNGHVIWKLTEAGLTTAVRNLPKEEIQ